MLVIHGSISLLDLETWVLTEPRRAFTADDVDFQCGNTSLGAPGNHLHPHLHVVLHRSSDIARVGFLVRIGMLRGGERHEVQYVWSSGVSFESCALKFGMKLGWSIVRAKQKVA